MAARAEGCREGQMCKQKPGSPNEDAADKMHLPETGAAFERYEGYF